MIGLAMLVMFDLLAFSPNRRTSATHSTTCSMRCWSCIYSTPALLVDLSPFIAMLATLNAYDRLNATSELIALRAAGVSGMRLGRVAGYDRRRVHTRDRRRGVGRTTVAPRSESAAHPRNDAHRQSAARQRLLDSNGHDVRERVGAAGRTRSDRHPDIRLRRRCASIELSARDVRRDGQPTRSGISKTCGASSYDDDGAPNAPEIYAEFDWQPTWDRTTRLYDLPIASFTIDELRTRVAHHANGSVGAQAEQIRAVASPDVTPRRRSRMRSSRCRLHCCRTFAAADRDASQSARRWRSWSTSGSRSC